MNSLLGRDDLLVSAATLSGAPPLSPSRWSLEQRVIGAASAGFSGIGVAWQEYRAWRQAGLPDRSMAALASEHGVRVAELEFLHGWASDDPVIRQTSSEAEDLLWMMADLFRARHVNVGDIGVGLGPASFGSLVERFSSLCDRAARHGLLVGYEWFPRTILPDLAAALRLVERADRKNAGLVVDVVHLVRAYGDAAEEVIRTLPPGRVVAVQLADGDASQVGLYAGRPEVEESKAVSSFPSPLSRRLPGHGSFDLVSLLRALAEIGVDAPIEVEIISPEMCALAPTAAAAAAYSAAVSVLELASGATTADRCTSPSPEQSG
jgi:sugar phosphate isomerase/epimerase